MKQTLTVANELTLLLDRRLALKQEIDTLDAERKEVDAAIQAEMREQGVDSTVVGDHRISLTLVPGRVAIDKMRLLEAGVTSGQIKAAEKVGEAFVRLDVRKVKQ